MCLTVWILSFSLRELILIRNGVESICKTPYNFKQCVGSVYYLTNLFFFKTEVFNSIFLLFVKNFEFWKINV